MKFATPLGLLGLLMAAGCVLAQPVYRNVDAHGGVSFSDRPSASTGSASTDIAARTAVSAGRVAGSTGVVPYELRQVMVRYPVVFYTGEDCAPCVAGRALLVARGVPFLERSVTTPEDSEALQRLSSQKSLPLLSIGTQQLKGFSDVEWMQYLDAAGYPKGNQLPVTYRNAPASPLVALRPASAAKTDIVPVPSVPRTSPVNTPNPDNPAGIRF
jgi:hypothetical protein